METNRINTEENSWKYWIIYGLVWGIFMLIIMNFIYPFFSGEQISWKNFLIALPIWIIGGLAFGAIMKFYKNQKGTK